MFCMKRSFSTSKSNLQIIFVLNEIFYPNVPKKNCDFSKILQFSETVIVLIFKTKTLILFIFFCMCIIQIDILEKINKKWKLIHYLNKIEIYIIYSFSDKISFLLIFDCLNFRQLNHLQIKHFPIIFNRFVS